jgi:hypothetical protein
VIEQPLGRGRKRREAIPISQPRRFQKKAHTGGISLEKKRKSRKINKEKTQRRWNCTFVRRKKG